MLRLNTSGRNSTRDEDVVQLLVEVAVYVGVSLDGRNASEFVDLKDEIVKGGENGASLNKFVPIAGEDDVRGAVQFIQGLEPLLRRCRQLVATVLCEGKSHSNSLNLGSALINVTVQWWARVSLQG